MCWGWRRCAAASVAAPRRRRRGTRITRPASPPRDAPPFAPFAFRSFSACTFRRTVHVLVQDYSTVVAMRGARMKLIRPIVLTILLTMLFPILSVPALAAETKVRFTIDAGGMARRNTPLAATLPAGTELQTPGWYDLIAEGDGAAIIAQVHRIGDEGPVVR